MNSPPVAESASAAPSVIVAEVGVGAFLENIALGPDGAFYITDYTGKRILRFREGEPLTTHETLDAYPLGIIFDTDGTLYISAQEKSLFRGGGGSFDNARLIYRARPRQKLTRYMEPPQAHFLDGWTVLAPHRLLVTDSRGGVVWQLDTESNTFDKYLVHPLLDTSKPNAPTPAANGVKVRDGYVYVSNTVEGTIVRARLDASGKAGTPEVYLAEARADDFEFSPKGTLVYTTHQQNVMQVDRALMSSPVKAVPGQLTGSTAMAWDAAGRGPYVITDGGFVLNQSYGGGAPSTAKIVRLNLGE